MFLFLNFVIYLHKIFIYLCFLMLFDSQFINFFFPIISTYKDEDVNSIVKGDISC